MPASRQARGATALSRANAQKQGLLSGNQERLQNTRAAHNTATKTECREEPVLAKTSWFLSVFSLEEGRILTSMSAETGFLRIHYDSNQKPDWFPQVKIELQVRCTPLACGRVCGTLLSQNRLLVRSREVPAACFSVEVPFSVG